MKYVTGDLLNMADNGDFDFIVQGCNCFHTMGGGIARQIAERYPEAVEADNATVRGDYLKLGTVAPARISRGTNEFCIANAYTQFGHTGALAPYEEGVLVDYNALAVAFAKVADMAKFSPYLTVGYPKIGAGLAGGDWDHIEDIIDRELNGLDHTCVVWNG